MYDAWGNRPLEVKGAIRYFGGRCSDVKNCEFRGIFSDGVGTFVAEWRVVDGVPIRDVLTDSSDIIDLFMHNIDPPIHLRANEDQNVASGGDGLVGASAAARLRSA